jgi:hypothetical protein
MNQYSNDLIFSKNVQPRILNIRGQSIIIDSDLAELYGVSTKRLNEQVKRNVKRFPIDFIFQLTPQEKSEVVAKCDHLDNLKYAKSSPYAFTEHGAIMVASVLNSPRAIEMSVFIVRAFVRLREILHSHKDLADKISELENKVGDHDASINTIIFTIKQMISTPPKPSKKIGFQQKTVK